MRNESRSSTWRSNSDGQLTEGLLGPTDGGVGSGVGTSLATPDGLGVTTKLADGLSIVEGFDVGPIESESLGEGLIDADALAEVDPLGEADSLGDPVPLGDGEGAGDELMPASNGEKRPTNACRVMTTSPLGLHVDAGVVRNVIARVERLTLKIQLAVLPVQHVDRKATRVAVAR